MGIHLYDWIFKKRFYISGILGHSENEIIAQKLDPFREIACLQEVLLKSVSASEGEDNVGKDYICSIFPFISLFSLYVFTHWLTHQILF
jgi:hypothetical protein